MNVLEAVKRWKFICVLFTLFLMLQTLDIATTLYGVTNLGLVEDNPEAINLMERKGLINGLMTMTFDNLGIVILLIVFSNWRVGPVISLVLLGGFAAQFIPTVVNNVSWITLRRGLYFNQMTPLYGVSFYAGALLTLLYLYRLGDLEEFTQYVLKVLREGPLAKRL